MIHLDSYEWNGETFIRTWDTENPDSVMESVQRPPLRIMPVPESELVGRLQPRKSVWQCFWGHQQT